MNWLSGIQNFIILIYIFVWTIKILWIIAAETALLKQNTLYCTGTNSIYNFYVRT